MIVRISGHYEVFSNENDVVSECIRSILGSVECYVNLLFSLILFIGVRILFSFYISLSLAICSWLVCVLGRLERSFLSEGYPALSAILCKYIQGHSRIFLPSGYADNLLPTGALLL